MALRAFLVSGALIALAYPAYAQSVPPVAAVQSACGAPTYTAGTNRPITQDTAGNQCVAGTVVITPGGTQDTNLKQVNGATVNVGAGAAGTGTQRVTTSTDSTIGTVTAVTAITNALPAGANIIGNVRIDQTTPGTTNGVVVNSSSLPTGAATAANQTNVQSAPGTPQTAAVTIQGNASGVAIPISGTVTASGVAQGSTTSGQTVIPIGCRTLTSAPTDTTAQTNMPSCTTGGALRTDGSSATQPVSGTVTATQATAANLNATVVGTGTFAVQVNPATRTIVALDISTVTTGGTAVTTLNAGHRTAGGFLQNPIGATISLCINEQGTASGTTSAGATTCIQPGQSYLLAPAAGAVSVITSDSSHPFSGYGLN